MFRVRKAQLDALAMKRFIDRVETTLLEEWLSRRVFDQDRRHIPLRKMIEHGVSVAKSYGLETEQDFVMFVLNMIDVNPRFHEVPHIQRLLKDKSLTFAERTDRLMSSESDRAWADAARIGDANAYWSTVLPNYWQEADDVR